LLLQSVTIELKSLVDTIDAFEEFAELKEFNECYLNGPLSCESMPRVVPEPVLRSTVGVLKKYRNRILEDKSAGNGAVVEIDSSVKVTAVLAVESQFKRRKYGSSQTSSFLQKESVAEGIDSVMNKVLPYSPGIGIDIDHLSCTLERIEQLLAQSSAMFEWQDGPLVTAMKNGDVFLLDEINLAEDAVIERLNSVLESGREITLAEKGGYLNEKIIAHPDFRILATMNPG